MHLYKESINLNKNFFFKISAINIFLIMLISVVQIQPNNTKKVNSVSEVADTVNVVKIDYTIVYDATNNVFYKNEILDSNKITDEELTNLGLASTVAGTIDINNANIMTTSKCLLKLVGDTTLNIVNGTRNVFIIEGKQVENAQVIGIYTEANLSIKGKGKLSIDITDDVIPQTTTEVYGIYGTTVNVEDVEIEVVAIKQAIKATSLVLDTTKEDENDAVTTVVCAATDIKGANSEVYSFANIDTY